jgi:RimJ/RimL family protein N-acetyltransferase
MHVFLETERLVLRQFTETDFDHLAALNSDPAVMRFLTGGRPIPAEVTRNETLPRYLAYYAGATQFGYWAAIEKATGDFLGWFCLRPVDLHALNRPGLAAPDSSPRMENAIELELGYRLRRSAWGKGYATEGARALIRKGFVELGAERVVAVAMVIHTASRRVMEKAGLTLVRTFHGNWPDIIAGSEQGDVEYAIEKVAWERQEEIQSEQ